MERDQDWDKFFGNSVNNLFWMALRLCALAFIFGIFTLNKKLNLENSGETTCKEKEEGEEKKEEEKKVTKKNNENLEMSG